MMVVVIDNGEVGGECMDERASQVFHYCVMKTSKPEIINMRAYLNHKLKP